MPAFAIDETILIAIYDKLLFAAAFCCRAAPRRAVTPPQIYGQYASR